jgi:protein gp37
MGNPKYQHDGDARTSGPGFGLTVHADQLDVPRRWAAPRVIFVNSMSDLFHKSVPSKFIRDVFAVMEETPRHTYQVLTKRPQRVARLAPSLPWPPNVWMGVTVESDRYVFRADHLRLVPAAVRFISAEPLLGPLDNLELTGIDWVIGGGESGAGARPMHPEWVRGLRDRCVESKVKFFFKQWGAWRPDATDASSPVSFAGEVLESMPALAVPGAPVLMRKMAKAQAGRLIDGRTWDELPSIS